MRIWEYVHLLPDEETKRFAIVFELKIPTKIAQLRDVLYAFAKFCYGLSKPVQKIKAKWNENLGEYDECTSTQMTLGSSRSHNTQTYPVSCTFDNFIVKNPFNCKFAAGNYAIPMVDEIALLVKKRCTLETRGEYAGLQWTLNSTSHTENEVYCSQSKCAGDLTLTEYKNFGSLRADGHRLQIRKLYAMIETEALSFENESVLALVIQTLWECGVIGEADATRESHADFADVKFCDTMITLLAKFVDQHRDNWVHPFKLLTATLVAIRAFEINRDEELANRIAKLLSQIRSIAFEWMSKIEAAIGAMANPNETTERNLRMKLIYVAIIGGLTFFVHPQHEYFPLIFGPNEEHGVTVTARRSWLRFIISLKNNVRMYTNDAKQLPSNLRMFLGLIESIGISLEAKVNAIGQQENELGEQEIVTLIQKHWTRAVNATFKSIHFHPEYPHILVAVCSLQSVVQTVTIDIITGSFLVDGLPLSRLPSEIIHSPTYRWFFGDVVFEVQPDAQRNFATVHKFNECSYEFKMIDGRIIITERTVKKDEKRKGEVHIEKELIDQTIFAGDFPYYLVKDYSHWWNKGEGCIEFRRKATGKTHFSKETTVDYRLDLSRRHLIHVQNQRPMMDINSDGYRKIVQHLQRLEHRKHIHVLLNSERVAVAELLRMNLKFSVECGQMSHLFSNEFSEMRVSCEQKIGTLCGLENGLILESSDNKRQMLLIPNGVIGITKSDLNTKNHLASMRIDTGNDLHSPPFFQYQVDKLCRQLKSNNGSHASWFYLAYLHAVTSHGQIEPFTGLTGTERALQILQSAFCWSSSPYEPEAVAILRLIGDLTPLRKLEKNMQVVNWPKHIPARAAQDCFVFIVTKMLKDSQRLRELYGQKKCEEIDLDTDLKLNERDHWRCQQLNPNLRVSGAFIQHT